MDGPGAEADREVRVGALGWMTLALFWAAPVVGSPVVVLVALGAVGLVVCRRWWAVLLVGGLSPVMFMAVAGAVDYGRGAAYVQGHGLPSSEGGNIDPVLRVPNYPGGCMVNGAEWMVDGPYDLAVRVMLWVLGPMRGSYLGPYPTQEEAEAAVRGGAVEVPLGDLAADRVKIGGATRILAGQTGTVCLGATPHSMALAPSSTGSGWVVNQPALKGLNLRPITAAVWGRTCLVVRVPATEDGDGAEGDLSALLSLVDLTTGRCFAHYEQGPRGGGRYPIINWLPASAGAAVSARTVAGVGGLGVGALSLVCGVGMLVSGAVRDAVRRRRERLGLCGVCGYDLWATPGRCPECGAGHFGRRG